MRSGSASRIMTRTTLDLDRNVLRELKRRGRSTGRSIGSLASELLANALHQSDAAEPASIPMRWRSARMGARVDLDDKEAVRRALESG
jgi:hypothetical protein